jgi:hypothetical protein
VKYRASQACLVAFVLAALATTIVRHRRSGLPAAWLASITTLATSVAIAFIVALVTAAARPWPLVFGDGIAS